jgi:Ala-tRNA(Pro) deacylase
MADVYAFLDAHGIRYNRCDHPAVFTVEESKRLLPTLPGSPTKNLFLRDQKGLRHFLVVVGHDKHVDLKSLAPVLGATKLSLGSPERLMTHLGIEPGSVSIFAILNDTSRSVEVLVDRDLWKAELVQGHPLVNTATLVVARADVERFIRATGHTFKVIEVPGLRAQGERHKA